jgi:hypothetical protein
VVAFRNCIKRVEKEALDHPYMKKRTAEDFISRVVFLVFGMKAFRQTFA